MTKRSPRGVKRNLRKSIAIALALLALVGIFYAITIIKLSKHSTLPHEI
ncbi:MAG: protoheme IX farnesyltransferase [Alphaproteobacteria bacterium]|jgi:hypothetical protein|nr:protoheme IX farnesyltransferase [Alphaproteobacteria bacterium]